MKTKQQKLVEAIPTLANHSIGVLWDGKDDGISLQPNDQQGLLEGAIPHADDMRVFFLSGALLEESCRQKMTELVSIGEADVDSAIYERLIERMSRHAASVLRFARFQADEGEDNITVKIGATFVHGRMSSTDANMITLLHVDTLCDECSFDVVKLSYETLIRFFEDLGFYIQPHGIEGFMGADGAMKNETRSFRLSWYKPSISEYRRKVEYASQVDAYISGVPLEDIFA